MNWMNRQLSRRYGSRRGFALSYWYWMQYLLGCYRDYQQIDWKSVERLVFICKGNICRSAYAESIARVLGVDTISGGIDTTEGVPANKEAVRAAAIRGVDLGGHRTRQVQCLSLKQGDLLIAMEPWQAKYLENCYGKQYACTMLGLWERPQRPYIHDPFGTSEEYFDICFGFIERSVKEIAKKISTKE